MNKIKLTLLILSSCILFACNSPEGKVKELEKLQKEISENNNAGSQAASMGDNNGMAKAFDNAGPLDEKEKELIEEIKKNQSKLSPECIERAKKAGVEF